VQPQCGHRDCLREKATCPTPVGHSQNEKANGTFALACLKITGLVEPFVTALPATGLSSERTREKEGRHFRHFHRTEITKSINRMIAVRLKDGTFYDGTAAGNILTSDDSLAIQLIIRDI